MMTMISCAFAVVCFVVALTGCEKKSQYVEDYELYDTAARKVEYFIDHRTGICFANVPLGRYFQITAVECAPALPWLINAKAEAMVTEPVQK